MNYRAVFIYSSTYQKSAGLLPATVHTLSFFFEDNKLGFTWLIRPLSKIVVEKRIYILENIFLIIFQKISKRFRNIRIPTISLRLISTCSKPETKGISSLIWKHLQERHMFSNQPLNRNIQVLYLCNLFISTSIDLNNIDFTSWTALLSAFYVRNTRCRQHPCKQEKRVHTEPG